MTPVELRARIRAAANDVDTFAAKAGLPVEVVRQIIAGEIVNVPADLRWQLAVALGIADDESTP